MDAGEDLDQRRFAGAVVAEDARHLAGAHARGDVLQGDDVAEELRQSLQLEQVRDRRRSRPAGSTRLSSTVIAIHLRSCPPRPSPPSPPPRARPRRRPARSSRSADATPTSPSGGSHSLANAAISRITPRNRKYRLLSHPARGIPRWVMPRIETAEGGADDRAEATGQQAATEHGGDDEVELLTDALEHVRASRLEQHDHGRGPIRRRRR